MNAENDDVKKNHLFVIVEKKTLVYIVVTSQF